VIDIKHPGIRHGASGQQADAQDCFTDSDSLGSRKKHCAQAIMLKTNRSNQKNSYAVE
jgi:hypothetical protein